MRIMSDRIQTKSCRKVMTIPTERNKDKEKKADKIYQNSSTMNSNQHRSTANRIN
jgi:hypothetical protein